MKLVEFLEELTRQMDAGVPPTTIRDFLVLNYGPRWEEEVSSKQEL
jgi:hypothetical protein